jgi:hypothetical protein
LKDNLRVKGKDVNFKDYKLSTLVSVLRTFLNKLPVPLLPFELCDPFLGATQNIFDSREDQMSFLRQVLSYLPDVHRDTLAELCDMFYYVLSSTSNAENKYEFAYVFGPALILRKGIHDFKRSEKLAIDLCLLLAENYRDLFGVASARNSDSRSRTLPRWLTRVNTEKIETLQMNIDRVRKIFEFLNLNNDKIDCDYFELGYNLELISRKLNAIKETIDRQAPHQVLFTYHLDRFFTYCTSLLDLLIQAQVTNRLGRYFKSSRLSGGLDKLTHSMQYELNLFCDYIDELYRGILKNDGKNREAFASITVQLVQDSQGQTMWRERFGIDRFVIPWSSFLNVYEATVGVLDETMKQSLKSVLDNADTGFVTVYKWAEFLKGFGPLSQSLEKVRSVMIQEWFHGFLTNAEAQKLLEPCEHGTFLVRFSKSDPGSFAINYKSGENVGSLKVETHPGGFGMREGGDGGETLKLFPSIAHVVQHYSQFFITPCRDKMARKPFFFGDFDVEETKYFVSDEPVGTFLVRFSSLPGCYTLSVVLPEGIMNYRLERAGGTELAFEDKRYADIDDFIRVNSNWCRYPFKTDNAVSLSQTEDEEKSERYLSVALLNDIDNNNKNIKVFPPLRPSQRLGEEQLTQYLLKGCKSDYNPDETKVLLDTLLSMTPEEIEKIQKKVHKAYYTENSKTKKKMKTASIKISTYQLIQKNVELNKPIVFSVQITNSWKGKVTCTVPNAVDFNRSYFLAISPSEGPVDPKNTIIKVTVVLYKPLDLRKLLTLSFKIEESDLVESFALPLRVSASSTQLLQGSVDDYWHVPRDGVEIINRLGGGASASVFLALVHGAKVACKNWDLGKRDPPPRDFLAELHVYRLLHHENLLMFIGGAAEPGNAFLLTEFASGGSLDGFLSKQGKEGRRWLTMGQKIQMAIEAARGMSFLHSNNRIHRDLKSLNLLVDETLAVKVADFGESRTAETNMTIATGTYNWMAPEVLTSRNYTAKADVFSFGIILWELLMNRLPDRSLDDVKEGNAPPVPPELEREFPAFVDLIRLCTKHNPNKRPTFAMLVKNLKKCQRSYAK